MFEPLFSERISLNLSMAAPCSPMEGGSATDSRTGRTGAGRDQREAADGRMELLCVHVGRELYGIDIMAIREVVKPRQLTEIPLTPSYIRGVISLRGAMVPVLSLDERLGRGPVASAGGGRVVVVRSGTMLVGLQVGQVGQVVRVSRRNIRPPALFADQTSRGFVSGVAYLDHGRIALLDLERVTDLEGCVSPVDQGRSG